MTEETKTISKESATELSALLSAVLNHPDTPSDLYNAIGDEICNMSNDLTTAQYCDSPQYIKTVLLASLGKSETEANEAKDSEQSERSTKRGKVELPDSIVAEIYELAKNAPAYAKRELLDYLFEKTGIAVDTEPEYSIEVSQLSEAISYVLKCPDTPEIIRHHLGDITFSTIQSMIDYDTPEMIERGLLAYEASGECDADNKRIAEAKETNLNINEQTTNLATKTPVAGHLNPSYNKQFEEAKEHLDVIIGVSDYDDFFVNALIALFGVIKKQSDLDKGDLLLNLQEYVFGHSRGFDIAANEYISKVTGSPLRYEAEETDESKD